MANFLDSLLVNLISKSNIGQQLTEEEKRKRELGMLTPMSTHKNEAGPEVIPESEFKKSTPKPMTTADLPGPARAVAESPIVQWFASRGLAAGDLIQNPQKLLTEGILSSKERAVPAFEAIDKGLGGEGDTGRMVGSFVRGATSITPFQGGIEDTTQLSQEEQMAERFGRMAYGNLLAAPIGAGGVVKNIASRAVQGGLLGTGMAAGGSLLEGELPTGEKLKEGALQGIENSWQLAFTNLGTDLFAAKYIPKLSGEAVSKAFSELGKTGSILTAPEKVNLLKQGAKLLFQRALLEVPAENTFFTAVDKLSGKEQDAFLKAWVQNLPGNVIGNLAFAGFQTATSGVYNYNKEAVDTALSAMYKAAKDVGGRIGESLTEVKPGFARLDLGLGGGPTAMKPGPQQDAMVKSMLTDYSKVKPDFDQKLKGIGETLGIRSDVTELKADARIKEKANADYEGDVSQVKDVVRGQLVPDTPEQARAALEQIQQTYKTTRVKDRFGNPGPDGYRDFMINVDLGGGKTGEIQIHLPEMLKAKEEIGHNIYGKYRTLMSKGKLSAADMKQVDSLVAEMKQTYDTAWESATKRLNSSSVISDPLRSTSPTGNDLPAPVKTSAPPSGSDAILTGTPSTSKNLVSPGLSMADEILPSAANSKQIQTEQVPKMPKTIQAIQDEVDAGINVGLEKFTKLNDWKKANTPAVPAKPDLPKPPPDMKQRKFSQTMLNSEATAPEVKQAIVDNIKDFWYKPITNKETKAEADNLVTTNINEALRIARDPSIVSALKSATQMSLITKYQNEGNHELAVDLADQAIKQATNPGQAIQALSMWSRLSPEGVLTFAQREISKATGGKGKLDPKVAGEISEAAKELGKMPEGRDKTIKAAQIMDKVASQVPKSLGQKLSTIQIFAQLLNPKTAIRNIIGNFGFAGIENVKDLIAYPIDVLTSTATGRRTKALPSIKTQAEGFGEGFKLGLEEALKGVDITSEGGKFDLPKSKTFHDGVGGVLQKALDIELKVPDKAFYTAAYKESLRQQMTAAKVETPTPDMLDAANYDALYRTFQDNSFAARIFTKLKSGLNAGLDFGLGDLILKYPRTPANILSRAIEYSPASFMSAVWEMAKPFIKGDAFNQKQFVEDISRGLTGTFGLVGTGAILHRLGVISGAPNEDKDMAQLERERGWGEYRLNVSSLMRLLGSGFDPESAKPKAGDLVMNYDWFQPQSISLAMGADIDAHNGGAGSLTLKAVDALASASNTLVDQPLLSGIQTVTAYRDLPTGVMAVASGMPASFVPTFLNQVKQLSDNSSRDTTDPTLVGRGIKQAQARIPYLQSLLPRRIDTRGVPMEMYQNGSNNLFNVLVNPSFVSRLKEDPVGEEVLEIYKDSGETQQAPRLVSRSIDITKDGKTESMKLTGEQVNQMQQFVGQYTNKMFTKLVANDEFQKLPDDEKAKLMSNMMSDVMTAAKVRLLGHRPKTLSNGVKSILGDYVGKTKEGEEITTLY